MSTLPPDFGIAQARPFIRATGAALRSRAFVHLALDGLRLAGGTDHQELA
jgi:hypothetical protein